MLIWFRWSRGLSLTVFFDTIIIHGRNVSNFKEIVNLN